MTDISQKDPPIKLSHYFSYGTYRGFELLLKPFPMAVVCVIGGIIGSIAQFLVPYRRRIVIHNLRIAYGDQMDIDEIHRLCRRTYWNTGANFLASVRANTMQPDKLREHIEILGIENARSKPGQSAGPIFLLAHMGSWETLVQIKDLVPGISSFGALYRPLGNPLLDKLVKRRRQKAGITLYSRKDGFFPPISHLKNGGALGVFSDQNVRDHGISVPLFGKLTSLTNLPILLHRRAKAPILPICMASVGLGKWQLTIYPAVQIPETEKTNATLTTSLCAQALESVMSKSPADVLWMHSYWKIGKNRPLKIAGAQKNKSTSPTTVPSKPFKVLIFAGDLPSDFPEFHTQVHQLKNYRSDIEITLVSQNLTSPDVAHRIPFNSSEPPHIIANNIRQYDLTQNTPIDCAIDFTPNAAGYQILKLSGVIRHFAMSGDNVSRTTKKAFKNPQNRNLTGLLQSLGMNAHNENQSRELT